MSNYTIVSKTKRGLVKKTARHNLRLARYAIEEALFDQRSHVESIAETTITLKNGTIVFCVRDGKKVSLKTLQEAK